MQACSGLYNSGADYEAGPADLSVLSARQAGLGCIFGKITKKLLYYNRLQSYFLEVLVLGEFNNTNNWPGH